ncbi:MAG: hypothetical protein WCR06_04525 [bacterium]
MKTKAIPIIAIICAVISGAHAESSMPALPSLYKRIAASTLVIVGTITNVETVAVQDAQWSRWQPVIPRAAKVSSSTVGALTIRIDETLYSNELVTTNAVLYLFGDWGFNTSDLDNYKGTQQIFILSKTAGAFVSAYTRWRLCEPLEKRDDIVKAIKRFQKTEGKEPNKVPEDTARKLADPQH